MISARLAYWRKNFGRKPCVNPSISADTKICPSVAFPAPIPIVGQSIDLETHSASSAGIFSSTIAKQPASANNLAS